MLASWLIEILRCPETRQPLEACKGGLRRVGDGLLFPDRDQITSLVYPLALAGDDQKMNRRYEWLAPFYDCSEQILGRLLTGVDIQQGRREIVDLLGLKKDLRLLEISPGPGIFHPLLREKLGNAAEIASLDLSLNMLRQCRKHQASQRIELIQANAQYLPFADESFDALFHFGGINLFNEPDRALREFVRVVRKNGLVSWGDEAMSTDFAHPVGRYILPRLNPGFRKTPPPIPMGVSDTVKYVVYGGLGYLMVARKSDTQQPLPA